VKACDSPIFYLYVAISKIFIGKISEAQENIEKSKKFQMNKREEMNLKAIELWIGGNLNGSIEVLVKIAKEFPTDLVAVYLCYQHYIFTGRMEELLALMEIVIPHHENNSQVLGMYCFGLEECGKFEEAEMIGLKAQKLNEMNPW
jgi:hypothetical protein